MAPSIERRKYIRISKSSSIKHVKFQLGGLISDTALSLSKDISAGGILFESNSPYTLGDIVRIELDLPGWEKFKPEFYKPKLSKSQPIVALVKVMRCERKGVGKYDIGAMFVGIDDGHQMALAKYIKLNSK